MALEGKKALIGFVGAPWTVFAYLVEGKGSKLFMKAKKWLYVYEEGTRKVLDILAIASADYLIN
jgi:uroporphyrinogen decarboxylase